MARDISNEGPAEDDSAKIKDEDDRCPQSADVGIGTGTNSISRVANVSDLEEILKKQKDFLDGDSGDLGLEGLAARIYNQSIGGKLFWFGMCMGGYCSPFDCCKSVYTVLWAVAFILCGGSCFYNLIKQDTPYHFFPVDVMMALVHIPGLFSLIFWRASLSVDKEKLEEEERESESFLPMQREPGSEMWEVVTFVKTHKDLCLRCGGCSASCQHVTVGDKMHLLFSFWGCLLMPVQIGMVALVYMGFCQPGMQHSVDGSFAKLHSWLMVFAVPPVVSCLVTSGALISIFIYFHILEADIISMLLMDRTQQEVLRQRRERKSITRLIQWGDRNFYLGDDDIQSAEHSNKVISYLTEIFMHVQDRVDTSCKLWSVIVTQFVCVAFLELLAVAYDISLIAEHRQKYEMTWHVFQVDLFLLISGAIGTTSFLLLAAALTKRLEDLVIDVIIGMRSRGVPPAMSFSMYSFLETAGRKGGIGFKIFGMRITQSHVITFFSLLSTALAYGIAHADYVIEVAAEH